MCVRPLTLAAQLLAAHVLGQHAPVALQLPDDPLVNDDVISATADTAAEVHFHVAARDLLIPAVSVSGSALFPALVRASFIRGDAMLNPVACPLLCLPGSPDTHAHSHSPAHPRRK